MMKISRKLLLLSLIGLFVSIIVPAQEIPLLPSDGSVSQGVLPNGMTYYIVENPSAVGMADFALVRRGTEGATIDDNMSHMDNVMVSVSDAVMDSTLLSLIHKSGDASPADQAIIVSGDVKAPAVVEKVRMLSYMYPVRDTAVREPYRWVPGEGLEVVTSSCPGRNLAVLTLTWRSQRTPEAAMNTIQPAISSFFVGQLGIIAKERIALCMRQMGIPAVNIGWSHLGSDMSSGDEKFSISVSVAPENIEPAVRIMSYVMSGLDSGTATTQEVNRAAAEYVRKIYTLSVSPFRSNTEYINRCASAFLHNGSLASPAMLYGFHASRQLDDETELTLFNGIASALLDKEANVSLECVSPVLPDSEVLADAFSVAWDRKGGMVWKDRPEAEALLKPAAPEKKMKITSVKNEPMSGGTVLVLENGMTVIVKNMPADKKVYYSLFLNGGYASVSGLSEGEGAFMTDYLENCRVAGVSVRNFKAALAAKGMTMDFNVAMTGTEISGSASKYDVVTIFQALSALTRRREPDPSAFEYYLATVPLSMEAGKGTYAGRMAAIDSLMCPGYIYSGLKSAGKLTPEFAAKAERFFISRFSRLDDGILVLAGDVDVEELKKTLALYGGEFRTDHKALSRPVVHYQPISGVSTYVLEDVENTVLLSMSARLPLTVGNYIASNVAAMTVRRELAGSFADSGWNVEVKGEFTVHPDERYNLVVSLTESPDSASEMSALEAMARLRSELSVLFGKGVSADMMAACRNHVKSRMELRQTDPVYWLEAISDRFFYGKDLYTGFSSKSDAVTEQTVQNIFSALDKGGKVEYVTTKSN